VEIFSRQQKKDKKEKAIAWRRNFSRIWCGMHTCMGQAGDEWGGVWFCAEVRRFRRRTEDLSLNGQAFAFKKPRLLFALLCQRCVKHLPVLTLFSG
jgi:hypothetical protein